MQSVQEMLAVFTFTLASYESLSGILPTGQSCVVPRDGRQASCPTHPHSLCSTHTTFPPVHVHPVRSAETAGRTDTRLELSGDIFPREALGSSTFLEVVTSRASLSPSRSSTEPGKHKVPHLGILPVPATLGGAQCSVSAKPQDILQQQAPGRVR